MIDNLKKFNDFFIIYSNNINMIEYYKNDKKIDITKIFNKTLKNKLVYFRAWQGLNTKKSMDYLISLEFKKDLTNIQKKYILNYFKKIYKNFIVEFKEDNFNDILKNKSYYIIINDIFKNDLIDITKELNYYKKYNYKNCYNYFIIELLKLKNKGFNTITKKDFDILKNKYVKY